MGLRLSFLTTGLAYGGAETQLVHLATRLKKQGFDIQIVSMLPPQAYQGELTAAEIPLLSLGMTRGLPDPRAIFKLADILRKWQPHVLHSHMVHANLLARVTRFFYHVPVVISTAHSVNEGGRWQEVAYRLTDPLCDLTTSICLAGRDRYIQVGAVPKKKICYVPNGIDTAKFRPDPALRDRVRRELGLEDAFVWLNVGRFEAAKDHATLVRAFARLNLPKTRIILALAGQGALEAETGKLVMTLGIGDRVSFLGIRKDISDLMNAADAYVLSSLWEGMPMVLLEAGATALPIVATKVGGNEEIVCDQETGLLVPPQDPQRLADAMNQMMLMPSGTREKMGQAARSYVQGNFSLDTVVERWKEVYQELLVQKGIVP